MTTAWTQEGGAKKLNLSLKYNAFGNITNKSDVGDYKYGSRPHAVTAAGKLTYKYDANGSMTSGAGRTLKYASFNKPTSITETGGDKATFVYGPDRARIFQDSIRTLSKGAPQKTKTLYLNNMEIRRRDGQKEERVHYINAENTKAIFTSFDDGSTATNKLTYLHRDHLGSVTSITNQKGDKVVERLSYDPWQSVDEIVLK